MWVITRKADLIATLIWVVSLLPKSENQKAGTEN